MRYLSLSEVLELHDRIISSSGGIRGIRDINALESAVNQPRQTFDQKDLYPDISYEGSRSMFFPGYESPVYRWEQKSWTRFYGNVSYLKWV